MEELKSPLLWIVLLLMIIGVEAFRNVAKSFVGHVKPASYIYLIVQVINISGFIWCLVHSFVFVAIPLCWLILLLYTVEKI